MTPELPETAELTTERAAGCPFDPPAALAELRAERPLSRARYPDGHEGWLVTSRRLARAVLADPRFSIRPELMHMPFSTVAAEDLPDEATSGGEPAEALPDDVPFETPPGMLTDMDPPRHTRYRKLLAGMFSVRRMRQLTEDIARITAGELDAIERQGPPVDLVPTFTQSVPALTICSLLGVPYERRDEFQRHAMVATGMNVDYADVAAGITALQDFLRDLALAKRAHPTDDMLSEIAATDLTDEELTNVGVTLLGAGLDTTANVLSLGTFALLRNPEQAATLREDPAVADQAVEELMRYLAVIPFLARSALEDVELDGQLVRKGETVTISIQAANRDPEEFADPDVLDLRRSARSHVGFGHGIHQCLGQQLARVEMRVAFPALFTRFPTLRLAVDADEVPLRTGALVYGTYALPVTWGPRHAAGS